MGDDVDSHFVPAGLISILMIGGKHDGTVVTTRRGQGTRFCINSDQSWYKLLAYLGAIGPREFIVFSAVPEYWDHNGVKVATNILLTNMLQKLDLEDSQILSLTEVPAERVL